MDEFDRKMKFLDDVLMNWEEDKECQLVTNEPAIVGDDATIQDDLGCEPLNQGEEVTEIHDDDQTDLQEESQEILEPPQETSINLEQVVLLVTYAKLARFIRCHICTYLMSTTSCLPQSCVSFSCSRRASTASY